MWIDCHFALERQGYLHYCVSVDLLEEKLRGMKLSERVPGNGASNTMNGNSRVLVDVAKLIQTPQKTLADCTGIGRIVRLKRFDDLSCLCGSSRENSQGSLQNAATFSLRLSRCSLARDALR